MPKTNIVLKIITDNQLYCKNEIVNGVLIRCPFLTVEEEEFKIENSCSLFNAMLKKEEHFETIKNLRCGGCLKSESNFLLLKSETDSSKKFYQCL